MYDESSQRPTYLLTAILAASSALAQTTAHRRARAAAGRRAALCAQVRGEPDANVPVYLYVRSWLIPLAVFACACSQAPTPTQTKAPEKPPEPITGRQAFQYTYGSARLWAADSQPLLVRSIDLDQVTAEDGKAGAWEIEYISVQLRRARTYTWSAVDVGDTFHKGVTRGPEESWQGPQGQQRPFAADTIKIDTPAALQTAVAKSADYLRKPGAKPRVNFLLEFTPRFPNPVWRVLWGASVGSAQQVVDVDASTGKFLSAN